MFFFQDNPAFLPMVKKSTTESATCQYGQDNQHRPQHLFQTFRFG